jgi:hypothetical protein
LRPLRESSLFAVWKGAGGAFLSGKMPFEVHNARLGRAPHRAGR